MTMIGAERPDTEAEPDPKAEVIMGVDTHLDVHVAVAVDHLGREAWARPACQRPLGARRSSSAGRRILAP